MRLELDNSIKTSVSKVTSDEQLLLLFERIREDEMVEDIIAVIEGQRIFLLRLGLDFDIADVMMVMASFFMVRSLVTTSDGVLPMTSPYASI
uniref:Uncharacterized protein n=1 Tax=Megaselia scalaris TaxID=36166 RepID=T1GST7_MEGSC